MMFTVTILVVIIQKKRFRDWRTLRSVSPSAAGSRASALSPASPQPCTSRTLSPSSHSSSPKSCSATSVSWSVPRCSLPSARSVPDSCWAHLGSSDASQSRSRAQHVSCWGECTCPRMFPSVLSVNRAAVRKSLAAIAGLRALAADAGRLMIWIGLTEPSACSIFWAARSLLSTALSLAPFSLWYVWNLLFRRPNDRRLLFLRWRSRVWLSGSFRGRRFSNVPVPDSSVALFSRSWGDR